VTLAIKMKRRPLHNLTIFVTQEKRMDFSEVTGVRALSFRNLSVGEIPPEAERGPVDTLLKRLSPDPWIGKLKKSLPSLRKY
jgi:hypothetical protein